ncbi:MAG: DUF1624 domain-containing protein [Acidobacteria bacterium]|nr:DUF1624 domain-containing protein [Acidobacteriota bacterium]
MIERVSPASTDRLGSIDVLRGTLMVVMAVDHVGLLVGRFHSQEMWAGAWSRYDSALPFLTRFITHFCAPGFFLLMGAGVSLLASARARQGWTPSQVARQVMTRGLVLVLVSTFLEVPAALIGVISGRGVAPPSPGFVIPGLDQPRWVLMVLFALGVSMMVSALLLRARSWLWAALAAAALLATALTTPGPGHFETQYGFARSVLMVSRWSHGVWSQYPLIPWFGVGALGVLLGRAIAADKVRTYRALPWVGGGMVAAALVLRAAGGFGNLRAPRDGSWIEFLNFIKYPPALVFTLFMVGGNLIVLTVIDRLRPWTTPAGRVLQVFGQAPLAFYVAHLWLFAILGAIWFRAGTGHAVVYLVWVVGLVPLYFFTQWFRDFKLARPPQSIWRMF